MFVTRAITKEAGEVFDPNVVLRVCVMEQEKIDVMWALTMWRHVVNSVAIVFGVGRNDIYANFRVLGFEFRKITQLYREGNALEIEGSLVIDVTGHAGGVDTTPTKRPIRSSDYRHFGR